MSMYNEEWKEVPSGYYADPAVKAAYDAAVNSKYDHDCRFSSVPFVEDFDEGWYFVGMECEHCGAVVSDDMVQAGSYDEAYDMAFDAPVSEDWF